MKAVVFHEHGAPTNLRLKDFPDPVAGEGDVIIRVTATSLNGFDPMIVGGTTGLRTPLPMIPCGDYAGVITELGPGLEQTTWKVGDRVCPHPFVLGEGMTGETRLGAACEQVRMPATNLVATPDAVTDVQAASLPIAYGTAHRMMRTRGVVAAGEKVLILGATGGVGTGCLQLAKAAGAEVIATGSGAWKLDKLRELGADAVIDTSAEDFVAAVHARYGKPRMWGGGGVDVVVNYIGGDTWAKSFKCLTRNGRLLTCGATAGYSPPTDIRYIWTYEQNVIGCNGWMPDDQVSVLQMVADGALQPVIHAVRPLAELPGALEELMERKVFGKIVITI